MSLSEKSRQTIENLLIHLLDEGWDSGMAYALIQDGPLGVKAEYWDKLDTYWDELTTDVMNSIVLEITGESLNEDTTDTVDGTAS